MSKSNEQDPHFEAHMHRLGPYIHPEHWDGHSFGVGEAGRTGLWYRSLPLPRIAIRERLAEYINDPTGRLALETYEPGDTFNPENYASGTIVAFRYESLLKAFVTNSMDLEGVAPAPIQDSLPSDKNFTTSLISLPFGDHRSLCYQNSALWGIVTRPTPRVPATVRAIGSQHIQGAPPEAVVTGSGNRLRSPLSIGKVNHAQVAFGIESVSRINRLEVCSHGTPERERGSVFGTLRRLATGSGMA